jgi:signal transduction histidine kinase
VKLSVRTRLAATFGGLFLLAGAILLLVNYTLVSEALPEPTTYAERIIQAGRFGATDPSAPTKPPTKGANDEAEYGGGGAEYDGAAGSGAKTEGQAYDQSDATVLVGGVVTDYRASAIRTVLVISGIALLIVGAMAALTGWLMAGRVLRPVRHITMTARRLEAERLDRRINLDGPHDELKELADTFDGMLDRLADSFDSQRRFVANASHELRTPLAVQRTLVEVAMADPTASPELMRLGAHLLHTNERNERLIDGLLVLARSDRGLTTREPVRLDRIVDAVVRSCADLAERAGVTLTSELAPRAVAGDPLLLERLVTNLVHNAIHYNGWDGTVHVEVGAEPALMIVNTGPTVPLESVSGLFEPFRRLDRDRTAHRVGAGLGLSIVRSVARAHGGGVDAAPNAGGGLVVSVTLPLSELLVAGHTHGPRVALGAHGGD